MVLGFFAAIIFILIQIGIVGYLIYILYSKKDEDVKNFDEEDLKANLNLRKMIVIESLISLVLYGVLISNSEILTLGRGEVLTLGILILIGLMMVYLYLLDNFIIRVKEFHKNDEKKIIV
ncbi:hypothetical protein [Clostridium sp.]|uniref:hypothetical protein n=1 Tax=Clostridium sp. TaxID=1506 RepID=UPI00262F7B0A|nr:hypothetical protein [Clostridium sp.]